MRKADQGALGTRRQWAPVHTHSPCCEIYTEMLTRMIRFGGVLPAEGPASSSQQTSRVGALCPAPSETTDPHPRSCWVQSRPYLLHRLGEGTCWGQQQRGWGLRCPRPSYSLGRARTRPLCESCSEDLACPSCLAIAGLLPGVPGPSPPVGCPDCTLGPALGTGTRPRVPCRTTAWLEIRPGPGTPHCPQQQDGAHRVLLEFKVVQLWVWVHLAGGYQSQVGTWGPHPDVGRGRGC